MSAATLVEEVSYVEGIAPIDMNAAAQSGNYISMANASGCDVIVQAGTVGASYAITLTQATDASGTSAKTLGFPYMWTNDASSGAAALTKTAVSSDTFNVDTANSTYVVPIAADTLDVDNGFDYVRVNAADPGAAAVGATLYVLHGKRHMGDTTPLS